MRAEVCLARAVMESAPVLRRCGHVGLSNGRRLRTKRSRETGLKGNPRVRLTAARFRPLRRCDSGQPMSRPPGPTGRPHWFLNAARDVLAALPPGTPPHFWPACDRLGVFCVFLRMCGSLAAPARPLVPFLGRVRETPRAQDSCGFAPACSRFSRTDLCTPFPISERSGAPLPSSQFPSSENPKAPGLASLTPTRGLGSGFAISDVNPRSTPPSTALPAPSKNWNHPVNRLDDGGVLVKTR